MQYGAGYDDIGNTTRGGPLGEDGQARWRFEANALNVHITRAWSNRVELVGTAASNATVTVNDEPTDRQGENFRAVLTVNNAVGPVETNVTVYAVWYDSTAQVDVVACASGVLSVAKAVETPQYDARASITNDSRRGFTFDALGRLTAVVNHAADPDTRETYAYYADGRRARIACQEWAAGPGCWVTNAVHTFTYDGWNPVLERVTNLVTGASETREYLWGLDLIGQRTGYAGQEAGGIGGLLAITVSSAGVTNRYLPVCDHNGNIRQVIAADTEETVAHYEYSPYGVLIGEWGPEKDICPFRFSTKYYTRDTGLYYFGYRHYDPAAAKWLSRDPLGEEGGINLTAFCRNDPVNNTDPLGLATMEETLTAYELIYGQTDYGQKLLSTFRQGGGRIDIRNVLGDLDVSEWSTYSDTLHMFGRLYYWSLPYAHKDPHIAIEKDRDPIASAGLLFAGLERSMGFFQEQLYDDPEALQWARQAAVAQAARSASSYAQLYLSGITLLNEGADWAMAANDLSQGDYYAALAFLPLISTTLTRGGGFILRRGDDVVGNLSVGRKLLPGVGAERTLKHHIFNKFRGASPASEKYRVFFRKHGISVDQFAVEIPESLHRDWLHKAEQNWTTEWKRWIDANPNATTLEVYHQAGRMMVDTGIAHLQFVTYP